MKTLFLLPLSLLLALSVLSVLSVAAAAPPAPAGPRIVALGTAQDGGIPQTGCDCSRCSAARKDPGRVRRVASLAIHVPATGRVYLVDATPDLPAQIERVHAFRPHPEGKTDRRPVDGVLLTHAHMGHYLGLAHFGFESLNAQGIPAWVSPRMAGYLRANGPWSQLVRLQNLALREIRLGESFDLDAGGGAGSGGGGVRVKAIQVPHRDEYSDTLAFLLQGPKKTVLYVPDTDSWRAWPRPLPDVLREEKVDVALLDGTFFSPDELPDRDVTKIKHPLITETLELLGPQVRSGKLRVFFTHLNHSNPALEPRGAARRTIEGQGFRVLADGESIEF